MALLRTLQQCPRTVSALMGPILLISPAIPAVASGATDRAVGFWPGQAAILTTSAAPLSPLQHASGVAQGSVATQPIMAPDGAAIPRADAHRTAFSTVVAGVSMLMLTWLCMLIMRCQGSGLCCKKYHIVRCVGTLPKP